jgi:hypothetical protein
MLSSAVFLKKGKSTGMFCYFCHRLWPGTPVARDFETRKQFDHSNWLKCIWCGHYVSVAARPEHESRAMNSDPTTDIYN